jgi:hypothetical protein
MRSTFDSWIVGLLVGLIVPVIAIVVFYYSSFTTVPFSYFIMYSKQIHVLPKLIAVGAIPNLGLFFLFMWRNHLVSARGVILATFVLAFIVLAMNLFF